MSTLQIVVLLPHRRSSTRACPLTPLQIEYHGLAIDFSQPFWRASGLGTAKRKRTFIVVSRIFNVRPSQIEYQGLAIDFSQPFRRATMWDLVKDATGLDFRQYSADKDLEGARSAAAEAVKAAGASHAAVQAVSGTYLIHKSERLK